MKRVLLTLSMVLLGCGDVIEEPLEVRTSELINGSNMSLFLECGDFGCGSRTAQSQILVRVPNLTGGSCKVAIHTTVGGVFHGASEAYLEAGIVGTRSCNFWGTCTNSWFSFGDFMPNPWVTSSGMAMHAGDLIQLTAAFDCPNPLFNGQSVIENVTTGQRTDLFTAKPANNPVFCDSALFVVERLAGSPLCNFGTMSIDRVRPTVNVQAHQDMVGSPGATTSDPSNGILTYTWHP